MSKLACLSTNCAGNMVGRHNGVAAKLRTKMRNLCPDSTFTLHYSSAKFVFKDSEFKSCAEFNYKDSELHQGLFTQPLLVQAVVEGSG